MSDSRLAFEAAEFERPPREYGPVAMWFLNARLEDGQLRRQVEAMAAGHVGGIQVAARTGLETPYFSQRWFDSIALIQDAAAEHGMPVWLADEDPYPSGVSGGEVVVRHPEFRAWQMHARRLTAAPGENVHAVAPGSVLLRACAAPLRNGSACWSEAVDLEYHVGWVQLEHLLFEPSQVYFTTRRFMSNSPRPTLSWRAPSYAEAWEVWLIAAAEIAEYKFFGSYVDLCNAEASRLFIATTYERYLERLGQQRFSQLAGFFLDEAHPQNWSWCLPEFFRQQRGYDLVQALPALWTTVGPDTARIRYDYRQSITELFDGSFMRPVAEWCMSHGVQLSLEVPSTRNIAQRHASVPGIDPGHDKVGVSLDHILARELPSFRGNLGFPASLAAQTGKPRVLDELFHSVGWSLTLQDMKAMLDRAAARGANLFAFHALCYSIGGLRKWDAPPSEFEQNPYWPYFPLLADYASRLAYALSRGRRVAPVAVVDPITSLWAHACLPGLELDDTGQHVMREWTSLMRELLAGQRSFDHIDPLMLAEAQIHGDRLRLGDAEYAAVVLPSMTNLEAAAWTKLQAFVSAGGSVIALGRMPEERIEETSSDRAWFPQVASFAALTEWLEERAPADLRLVEANRDVLLAQRREGEQDLFFLANASMSEHEVEVNVRARADGVVTRLDLETGALERLPARRIADDVLRVHLALPPHGAGLLMLGADLAATEAPLPPAVVDLALDGEWQVDLADEALNVLRLDRFSLTLTDSTEAVIVEPKPLINLLRDVPGHIDIQPRFGAAPHVGLSLPVTTVYASRFTVRDVPRRALVCVEEDALRGEWQVSLNGHAIPREAFARRRRWSIDNLEVPVTELLATGSNELLVQVRVEEPHGGLVDGIYLLGDFGVFFDDEPMLSAAPSLLAWGERHTRGYPYFSGTFVLRRTMTVAGSRVRLPEPELMFAGVVELAIDGQSLGVRAWAPFIWDVPSDLVSEDESEVTLRITTALLEQLEGKRYDPLQRRTVPIRQ